MLHWNFSSGLLGKQVKARRPKASVKPTLDVLEDRTMPSTVVSVASPPPVTSVPTVTSYAVS
ncbi:MAG TPA: hypothetical protein VMF69_14785, partial [Gemmataceae bacterium]|nr:hypothetical protein [Gemmataceae bacterium]